MSGKARPDLSGSEGAGGDTADPADGLSPQQAKAVAALLSEPTMERAAEVTGVAVRTLQRWKQEEGFGRALLRARREAFGQAVGVTQRYAPLAVGTLVKILSDASAPAAARISAGVALLKFGREGIETEDFAARLEALERAVRGTRDAIHPREGAPQLRLAAPDQEAQA